MLAEHDMTSIAAEGIVGYSDTECKRLVQKMSDKSTRRQKFLRLVLGPASILGLHRRVDAQHSPDQFALFVREVTPEAQNSEFVRIFDELTDQWAARRHRSA